MSTRAEFSPPRLEQLVADSTNGDTIAFDQLFNLYEDRIRAFVARRLPDPVEAEDIVQEAFVKAYRHLPSFRGASSFGTWLYRIAHNLTIDSARKRRRRGRDYSVDAPLEVGTSSAVSELTAPAHYGPEKVLEAAELRREVHYAIRDLSPKLRAVLVLYELDGLNYGEIAVTIGCPVGTVKSRLFKARDQLKRNLLCSRARTFLPSSFVEHEEAEGALSRARVAGR